MRFPFLICASIMLSLAALPAHAQDAGPPPAHISFVEGAATLDHDGESEPIVLNLPILEGDRIRTQNGRVEVMFPDGSAVAIDPYSEVELLAGARIRVLAGAIEHIPAPAPNPYAGSNQYLPSDLQMYGSTFDQYGSWQ